MQIDKKDLKVERFRASGKGGQNVNKVETAIRLTHIPTGLVAQCQEDRSQAKNYKAAMATLVQRIETQQASEKAAARNKLRNAEQGKGRVRTYNLTNNMLVDNVRGIKANIAKEVLDGNLDLVYDRNMGL